MKEIKLKNKKFRIASQQLCISISVKEMRNLLRYFTANVILKDIKKRNKEEKYISKRLLY